ncbi:MAG: general secretion pathway protein GspB [Halioglobus sp.]
MSLILDALSRSQRERDGDAQVPGIETQHYHAPMPEQRNWRVALPWVGLGLAIVVIAFLLVREEGASQTVEPVSSSVAKKPQSVVLAERASAERSAENVAATADEPVIVATQPATGLPATPASSQVTDSQPRPLPKPATTVAASPKGDAVAALYETSPSVSQGAVETADNSPTTPATQQKTTPLTNAQISGAVTAGEATEPVEIEALLARAQQEVAQSRLSEHAAPFLEQLSQQKKDQVPTLMYSRHDYSSQPSQSRVLINGKTAKVGDTVASGVKLEEILPDSSVFSYRGEPFRLVALNSWVNL